MPKSVHHSYDCISYPFAAVTGHRVAKHALLLLAVEPELRGALVASRSGSAKSILARSFASIFSSDPLRRDECSTENADQPVEIPLGVTEDRLLGGLDLELTLAMGKRQIARGLLAQADGHLLYVDNINLLEPDTATHIAHALDCRRVSVERESVSATHSADFVLVATFNPAEGKPSSLLRDRVGLIVEACDDETADERTLIIEQDLHFQKDPAAFSSAFEVENARIKRVIETARRRLPRVTVSRKRRRQIAEIAMRLAVEGNRADVFALKAARANAALSGRETIDDDDLVVAVQMVLAPRATTLPLAANAAAKNTQTPAVEEDQTETREDADLSSAELEDLIIAAIDAGVPKDLLAGEQQRSRAQRAGKRLKGSHSSRGRYVRSDARRTPEARVAVDATLRAAAPFQRRRMLAERPAAQRGSQSITGGSNRVVVQPSDLRYKKFKHRSGILFVFAVDASGSMAVNRMAQAKGALTRLLSEAYLHRDKVALISFRGSDAQVLLAPTRSVELAKRLVDALPAGGGTPISAGVLKAVELARLSRQHGLPQAMLVLFTDGRANIAFVKQLNIDDELKQLGALLQQERISSVIVDTKARFLSNSEGIALARMLGSRYLSLPHPDTKFLNDAIISFSRGQIFNV